MTMKRIGTVLGIAALLVISYFIPTIIIAAEDNALKKETRTFEIESVTITQNTDGFYEEMDNFPEILTQDMMYVKTGKNLTEEKVLEVEEAFVKLLSDSFYQDSFSDSRQEQLIYHEENAFLTTSADRETIYYLWNGYYVDSYGREYTFYIDDTTGKVLGFGAAIPEYFWVDDQTLHRVCSNLMEYYGYQEFEFSYPDGSGASCIIFHNEDNEETLIVPLVFTGTMMHFNMMDNYLTNELGTSMDTYSEEEKKKLGLY